MRRRARLGRGSALGASGSLVIEGGNFAIDGASTRRGFTVLSGNVTFHNLTIQNTLAKGGAGLDPPVREAVSRLKAPKVA